MRSLEGMRIVKLLAEKYNLTQKQVLEVVESPFKFQHHIMTQMSNKEHYKFPSLKIISFGRFAANECNMALHKKKLSYWENIRKNKALNGLTNTKQGEQVGD